MVQKNQTFKYQVSGIFLWNGGSWDVQVLASNPCLFKSLSVLSTDLSRAIIGANQSRPIIGANQSRHFRGKKIGFIQSCLVHAALQVCAACATEMLWPNRDWPSQAIRLLIRFED